MKTKQIVSTHFHKVEPSRWPKDKDCSPIYKDDEIEVVQALRSLKFFYRFYVRYRAFVFWTEQTDLGYLARLRNIRRSMLDKLAAVMSSLDVPADVLPGAEQ